MLLEWKFSMQFFASNCVHVVYSSNARLQMKRPKAVEQVASSNNHNGRFLLVAGQRTRLRTQIAIVFLCTNKFCESALVAPPTTSASKKQHCTQNRCPNHKETIEITLLLISTRIEWQPNGKSR